MDQKLYSTWMTIAALVLAFIHLWNTSEEFRNGMRQGDIIVKINNDVIDSFDKFTHYRFVKGEEYTFTLIDSRGFTKEVKSTR